MSNRINTTTIVLGMSEDLAVDPNPEEIPNNFIRIHRNMDPLNQKWGNFCSKIVTRLSKKAENGEKIRWYHVKLFNFCYAQYDKYGDYFKIIDNTYGTYEQDGIYEVV